jgi:hypothetical protein
MAVAFGPDAACSFSPAGVWHVNCYGFGMTDERYVTLLLWTICVLTFACGVVALTEHPEWFGA